MLDTKIKSLMKKHSVPSVSYAYLENEKIITKQFGYLSNNSKTLVNKNTKFQTASLSKFITSLVINMWCIDNNFDISNPIQPYIKELNIPKHVTLKKLLSHSAGYNVKGFSGYSFYTKKLPSLLDIIKGNSCNSSTIKQIYKSGYYKYSGGGYCIAQYLIEKLSNKPLNELAQNYLFNPLNMQNSSFDIIQNSSNIAYAHTKTGRKVKGGYKLYPESAAAGLWSTPYDFILLNKTVLKTLNSHDNSLLTKAAKNCIQKTISIKEYKKWYGLGVQVTGSSSVDSFSHHGSNKGYNSFFTTSIKNKTSLTIMTNSEQGDKLIN